MTAGVAKAPRDIVVIGGGIIGASTCYYLTRHPSYNPASTRITLVEGSSIAAGASGKAGGLLALDWHGASTSSLAALSYELHHKLAEEHEGPKRWGYRALETLSVQAQVGKTATKPLKTKDVFDWLDADILTGTSVLGSKNTTAQAHPRLLTEALVKEAQNMGVAVVHGTVNGFDRSSTGEGRFTLSYKPRDGGTENQVSASDVVVAAGPWTGQLCRQLGLRGGRAAAITGSRAHSVVIQPAPGRDLPAQALFTSIKEGQSESEPEIYNRPDNTAYACGPTDSSSLPPLASDVKVVPDAIESILRQVGALSPSHLKVASQGGSASVQAEQACYLPVGSGDPVIGQVEPGVWVASGHSCWGIMNGPATGCVMAEQVFDGVASSANIKRLAP